VNGRVIVVGSVNVDLVVRADRLPAPGETVLGGTFDRFHGGKGGNQAVAAARLGARVALVAAVGDDAFGDEAAAALEGQGVETDEVARLTDSPTGVALILVDAAGENLIAVAPGANAALGEAQVSDALARLEPAPGDVVLVVHEIPTAAARGALRLARDRGATTVFNPAPATGLDRPLLALADVLTPNRGELARLAADDARRSGRSAPAAGDPVRAAQALLDATSEGPGVARAIVVSLGAAGAVLVPRDGPAVDFASPPVSAIDATGAGDTLNGALAAGLAEGLDLTVAATRAVVAASLSVTRAGAREGMPTREELEAALAGADEAATRP
jgi:ribokinase